ncbi:DNA translocase FtsK [Bacillus sonorensis]|uniref:DNA translocase SftA n=3 Tax=Bacillus sonorensis TaxID=119858 RepID=A0ABM6LF49_9BACI|nr:MULTISPECIES: DNA translocase FtsK [Bacillus]ASB87888.1 DNA translocase SftA [Bacillus sonorensis]MCZ0071290.1 DNA translocase FtsK [Bacillus sonorensis]MCZ0089911.1 DNA translocase FtsK [Bacillus sonorensis]MEC0527742.1 DNA translocase FtsK [Bacillus sonorensis]NWN78592.1 cell division protein FtsK [Bacillus sp. (in: firmicutes)]
MSWINKMFGLFLGDDEHNEKKTKNMSEEPQYGSSFEENEEMPQISDAKVVYEYPKGKFRFPVIPDQKVQQRENSRERQQRNRQSYSNPSVRQRPSDFSRKETEKPAKRPFKPSVIPSPVYGFHEQKRVKPNDLQKNKTSNKQKEQRVTLFTEEIEKEQRFFEERQPFPLPEAEAVKTPAKMTQNSDQIPVHEAVQTLEPESLAVGESASEAPLAETHEEQNGPEEKEAPAEQSQAYEAVQESAEPESLAVGESASEAPLAETHEEQKGPEEKEAPAEQSQAHEAVQESAEPESLAVGESASEAPLAETHEEQKGPEEKEAPAEQSQAYEAVQESAEPESLAVGESASEAPLAETHEEQNGPEEKEAPAEQSQAHETVQEPADSGKEQSFFEEKETAAFESLPHKSTQEEPLIASISTPDEPKMPYEQEAVLENEAISEADVQHEDDSDKDAAAGEAPERAETNADEPELFAKERAEDAGQEADENQKQRFFSDSKTGREKNGSSAESKPQRGSSAVPFNVMMLASDKQKGTPSNASGGYEFPNLALLDVPPAQKQGDQAWVNEQRELLDVTLENFNVKAHVVHVTQGPSVTRFEVHPEPGVKVNKITNLSDDIKLSLSAKDIRIEAPIPGKNTIGIEVPNLHSKMVYLREMIRSPEFRTNPSPLTAALGLDISGKPVVADLKKMPHGLIAGATGSGKSVCLNTILVSLLFKAAPSEVKLLLIDPKMVELAPYNEIPHLVSPVITDAKAATAALKWVVEEMERRYELFAHSGVRGIERFNEKVYEEKMGEKLPYLVVVIDELADLMMVAPNEVEESICRIAQKARACGIHLLIATQRPSVDVITGLIKANIPTRIAFSVSSGVDSRTIIDMAGAEKLLGKGDMLFLENGSGKPVRLQGNFVSDQEIDRVVSHVRKQQKPSYLFEQEELIRQNPAGFDHDELFLEACEFAVEQNSASTSSLQRRFRIGYNRAARLIDMMEREGMISEAKGSKPREVLITRADLEQLIESSSLFS